jgi:uncharacterized protein (DUF427 family)
MGLSWQQGPLGAGPAGRFLTPDPLPPRLLYAEPLRRRMRVRFGGEWIADSEQVIADSTRPLALYESGFAPRWYVPRDDLDEQALTPADGQTFCPYKGLASYYDIGQRRGAAWSYPQAWPEVSRVANLVSFEPQKIDVYLDGTKLALEPGQTVIPHGIDRGLDPDEILHHGAAPASV